MSGERCDNCDKPIATQVDYDAHPDGCECATCRSLCWRLFNGGGEGGVCNQPGVNWRKRALAAESRERALVEERDRLRAALKSVSVGLGDRLLAKGSLSEPYAHDVMRQIRAALTPRAATTPPTTGGKEE